MGGISIFRTTPRIVMGPGAVHNIGQEALGLGAKTALIVTDKGIRDAGLIEPVEASLKKAGVGYTIFNEVEPDPRFEIVDQCLNKIKGEEIEVIIGLGGGSPIDIAKVTSIMRTNKGRIADYFGVDLVPEPGLPTIMVPTTAGTGSEVTPIAILSDEGEKLKKGVVSPRLFPAAALLDPELTLGLPPQVTASTGMDALIHAIEAYTSVNATRLTDILACQAVELISENIRTACAQGSNLAAREAMLEGSLLAGLAFANAGVTAVHAFAYPIGAEFHIPHGVANTLMLPAVMEFNMLGNLNKFAHLAELFGEDTIGLSDRAAAEKGIESIHLLSQDLNVARKLSEFGVKKEDIPQLAEGVMKTTRLLANNPRVLTLEDARDIYLKVL